MVLDVYGNGADGLWRGMVVECFFVIQVFDYTRGGGGDSQEQQKKILEHLESRSMAPFYEHVCSELKWEVDDMLLGKMRAENEARLAELEQAISIAEENEGDTEVKDAMIAKAEYLADIGNQVEAAKAFDAAHEKTAGSGPKMDLVFSMLRLDLALGDWIGYKKELEKAWDLCAKGGDWERKNKLKVYQAIYLMATRQCKPAAEMFLNSIATFTATELLSYDMCVFYTVILAVISLDRPSLMANVVENPEILAAIDSIPHLKDLLMSLYQCQYGEFFKSLADISDTINADMLLHPHYRFYLKEARVVVYAQYLQSYKSVKMDAMASTFGVSVEFLDDELAHLIVQGRLPAKLDRVDGVVFTTRPDPKNAAYQQTIRQGDHVLNKLQKLSKLADVE